MKRGSLRCVEAGWVERTWTAEDGGESVVASAVIRGTRWIPRCAVGGVEVEPTVTVAPGVSGVDGAMAVADGFAQGVLFALARRAS